MLNIVSAQFIKSAVFAKDFPATEKSEFAFFGRSNSGKSSLINMILNRKSLVKVSTRPGMTQTVNFFSVNEAQAKTAFYLADLPGYGFAKLKKHKVQEIDTMLYDYCLHRENLKVMFLLMDIRRPPSSVEKDISTFFADNNINFEIVATKADKVSRSEQNKSQNELARFFELPLEKIIVSSSLKKTGREKLLNVIQNQL